MYHLPSSEVKMLPMFPSLTVGYTTETAKTPTLMRTARHTSLHNHLPASSQDGDNSHRPLPQTDFHSLFFHSTLTFSYPEYIHQWKRFVTSEWMAPLPMDGLYTLSSLTNVSDTCPESEDCWKAIRSLQVRSELKGELTSNVRSVEQLTIHTSGSGSFS